MDKDLLTNSFKSHAIFSYFWCENVLDFFSNALRLDFVPQDPISIFQKRFEYQLDNLGNSPALIGMNAKVHIVLTSFESNIFDFERAINDIDSHDAKNAILVTVEIRDNDGRIVFSTKFNLGSKDAEDISTSSEYMKRFSFLY